MSPIELSVETDAVDPIDIVEHMAESHRWSFDRVDEDQIAMVVEGQWRSYSVTLAWDPDDEVLRLICSFEMSPPQGRLSVLHDVLNAANDECWLGAFTYWSAAELMVYRYGLSLAGGQVADSAQIGRMISAAVSNTERFYPAFQLAGWGDCTPAEAMQIAISEAYGHA